MLCFTGESNTKHTNLNHALLTDLYPGAGYELKVYAISNGLWSKPHVYFQAVCKWNLSSCYN